MRIGATCSRVGDIQLACNLAFFLGNYGLFPNRNLSTRQFLRGGLTKGQGNPGRPQATPSFPWATCRPADGSSKGSQLFPWRSGKSHRPSLRHPLAWLTSRGQWSASNWLKPPALKLAHFLTHLHKITQEKLVWKDWTLGVSSRSRPNNGCTCPSL